MKVRPAQFADVSHILGNISDVSAREMVAFGTKPWDALRKARYCMKGAGLDAICCDDKPIAVFGAAELPDEPDALGTWFLASQAYFDRGARSTLFSRKHMAEVAASHRKKSFLSYSASRHPDVVRWFNILGFRLQSDLDLFSVYRYCREC